MIPIVEIIFHYSMLPLVKINVHQVGMIPLVNREFHHWILSLVGKNVHQGLLLVEIGDQGLPLVQSGYHSSWIQVSTFASLFLRGIGGKCCTFDYLISTNEVVSQSSNKPLSHLRQ